MIEATAGFGLGYILDALGPPRLITSVGRWMLEFRSVPSVKSVVNNLHQTINPNDFSGFIPLKHPVSVLM